MTEPIKKCPNCGKRWKSLEDIIEDRNVDYLGMQFGLTAGCLLFNHNQAGCGTSFTIGMKDLEKYIISLSRKGGVKWRL